MLHNAESAQLPLNNFLWLFNSGSLENFDGFSQAGKGNYRRVGELFRLRLIRAGLGSQGLKEIAAEQAELGRCDRAMSRTTEGQTNHPGYYCGISEHMLHRLAGYQAAQTTLASGFF